MGDTIVNETMVNDTMDPNQLKLEGNQAFNEGDWDKALSCYTKAINLSQKDTEKAVYLKNRAAAYLKKSRHDQAIEDCSAVLEISPRDPKALFRRCQALEALERYEEAYRDAQLVLIADPGNKAIQPVLKNLHVIVQARVKENAQTANKVAQMFNYAFDLGSEAGKRETAINNLLVLARERSGSEIMVKEGILQKLHSLIKVEKSSNNVITAIRIISEICKNNLSRCKEVIQKLGIPFFLDLLNSKNEAQVNAAQYCIQKILDSLDGMDKKDGKKPYQQLLDDNKMEIEAFMSSLLACTTSRALSGLGRDAIIELLMKNSDYYSLNWCLRLVELDGLQRLMEVASELQEYRYESCMEITDSTRTLVSLCLSKIYENMYYDKAKELFLGKIDIFIKEKLLNPEIEAKVRATAAITSLLLGPVDVGNNFVAREGILEMILVMAGSEDFLQQKVASEAIIAAASKKDKVRSIVSQGINILKKLYQSKNDNIKVRALVGLCKLSSSGGTDATIRPFSDGSSLKLAEACRRFLINPARDRDMRKWAAEGLSYLTLDAEVKEKLIEDKEAVRALMELAQSGDKSVVYAIVTTFVNLTNAYDKQEILPEMIELAKFAKQHIPEEHELDDPDFVEKRTEALCKEGAISALVALSKTESQNIRELICRVLNSFCSNQNLRGSVVQQGGAKVLIPFSLEGTEKGKKQAAQALARIGITTDPEVAFPGQRCCEVIRPLVTLLHPECDALETFEALMALCNLAGVSETVRKCILKDNGMSSVEHYHYDENMALKRASMQVMTNMCSSPDMVKRFEGKNDRIKYLVLLCNEEEDEETVKAIAASLAILTSDSRKCCKKILEVSKWLESIRFLLANPDKGISHRGAVLVYNMMTCSKAVAEKLIETDIMELLMALTKLEGEGSEKIREICELALKAAEEWKLIKKPGEESDSDVE